MDFAPKTLGVPPLALVGHSAEELPWQGRLGRRGMLRQPRHSTLNSLPVSTSSEACLLLALELPDPLPQL